ncbi:MAG: integrase [Dehalococcoidia bacterium]|nr:integrase [Dehalococcoidia bacterium]
MGRFRLGHANIAVTANTYSHVLPELQREAVGKVGALLFGAPNA